MKRSLLTVACILALVAGCASNKVWIHKAKGEEEFYADMAECQAMSNSSGPTQVIPGANPVLSGWNQGAAIAAAQNRKDILNYCMRGKGWRLVDRR
jgi:hypothetical protein